MEYVQFYSYSTMKDLWTVPRRPNRSRPSLIRANARALTSRHRKRPIDTLIDIGLIAILLPDVDIADRLTGRQKHTPIPQRPCARVVPRVHRLRVRQVPRAEVRDVSDQVDVLAVVSRSIDLEEHVHLAGHGAVGRAGRRGGHVDARRGRPGADARWSGDLARFPRGGVLTATALCHGNEGGVGPG